MARSAGPARFESVSPADAPATPPRSAPGTRTAAAAVSNSRSPRSQIRIGRDARLPAPLTVIDRRHGIQIVIAAFPEIAADEKTSLQCLGVSARLDIVSRVLARSA